MSDDTKADDAANEQAENEAAERAAEDAAAKAEADEAAQAEGFADAQAKADADAAAAAKTKKPRKPRETKPKSPSPVSGLKPLGIEAAVERVASGSHGGFNVRFGNEHGPHRDIPAEAAPSCGMLRGRVVTRDRLVVRTRNLTKRTQITHAWLFDGDDALVPQELAAPVSIAPGEQFVIEAGRFAFF